jgi:hypothetical protein
MESDIRSSWVAHLLSTQPADRPRAEAGYRDLYSESGFQPPSHFFWFDSPLQAGWAAFLLTATHDSFHRRRIKELSRDKQHKQQLERVRAYLCTSAQLDWEALTAIAGATIMTNCWIPNEFTRVRTILPELAKARREIHPDLDGAIAKFDERDDLQRAEMRMSSVLEWYAGPELGPTIKFPLAGRYSFSEMAMDEAAAIQITAPPLLEAMWGVSRSAGRWWWPFFGCVVISERPVEIRVNDQLLLHRPDGPALVYRDGTSVWAWEGGQVAEDDMLHPENIPPTRLKRCSPSFREFVASRVGTSPHEGQSRKEKLKSSIIFKNALPPRSWDRVSFCASTTAAGCLFSTAT